MSSVDSLNIERIIEESRRARQGLEPSGTTYLSNAHLPPDLANNPAFQPTYQVIYEPYVPPGQAVGGEAKKRASPVRKSFAGGMSPPLRSSFVYDTTPIRYEQPQIIYQQQPPINYGHEMVKRAAPPVPAPAPAAPAVIPENLQEKRVLIIQLGGEVERLKKIGQEMEDRVRDSNNEISNFKNQIRSKEDELSRIKGAQGDNSKRDQELRRLIDERTQEIQALKNNALNASPEAEKWRRNFKDKEIENAELRRKMEEVRKEHDGLLTAIKKEQIKSSREPSQWCC